MALRLTVRTNLAMRILMFCAVRRGDLVRSADMAEACNASTHHVAQVVNQLSALGYLHTLRGRTGGVKLARDPATVTVGEVFLHFESGVPLTECFDEAGNTCPLRVGCRLRNALSMAVEAFYEALQTVTLQELVCDNLRLETLFAGHACAAGAAVSQPELTV
ncbi:MAG: RrF2 family transcriptional regulator [Tropicimonas sp.]|uniref:RrF2 family transcriptional regulator n=1 Tax=Tropicimonas sp. TaxID=2067044 RepID=UPI003A8A7978